MCCSSRSKDDVRSSQRSTIERPHDFIKTRPGLVRVLKWFDEVEEKFHESMIDVGDKIDNIIAELDEQSSEEVVEVGHGQEQVVKVVGRDAVAEALAFGSHRSNFMQTVIETIEFFKMGDD